MSATGRGAKREPRDLYETPSWCVRRLLEVCPWLVRSRPNGGPGCVWDPCAGRGAILRAVDGFCESGSFRRVQPLLTDLVRHDGAPDGVVGGVDATRPRDLTRALGSLRRQPAAIITNPPYNIASDVLRSLRYVARNLGVPLAALVRVGWLTPKGDRQWLREDYPDVWLLPDRPIFVKGRTDSCEYAWAVWDGAPKMWGRVQPLQSTPLEERRRG